MSPRSTVLSFYTRNNKQQPLFCCSAISTLSLEACQAAPFAVHRTSPSCLFPYFWHDTFHAIYSSDSLRCKDGIYPGGDDGLDVAQSGVLDRRDTRYLGA